MMEANKSIDPRLSALRRAVTMRVYLEAGLVPMERADFSVARSLENVPDAREMKRRFRKVWRKLAREKMENTVRSSIQWMWRQEDTPSQEEKRALIEKRTQARLVGEYGWGSPRPSRAQLRRRRELVKGHLDKKINEICASAQIRDTSLKNAVLF